MKGNHTVLSTEFIDFKYEQNSPYLEVWLHHTEGADSDYVKSSRLAFTEEETKDPITMWCLAHAPDFQPGDREAIAEFVESKLGDELPLRLGLKIIDALAEILPSSGMDIKYFYTPELEFFHYGSPVVIDSINKEKLLAELKALTTKKKEG